MIKALHGTWQNKIAFLTIKEGDSLPDFEWSLDLADGTHSIHGNCDRQKDWFNAVTLECNERNFEAPKLTEFKDLSPKEYKIVNEVVCEMYANNLIQEP